MPPIRADYTVARCRHHLNILNFLLCMLFGSGVDVIVDVEILEI